MKEVMAGIQSPSRTTDEGMEEIVSREGLKCFLASPYVKGVGPVFAGKIAEAAGYEVLNPDFDFKTLFSVVSGLSENKIEEIKNSLVTIKFDPLTAVMLYSAGLRDIEVEKILSHYGKKAGKALLEDPYDMVENAWKVSFFTADKLGKWLGVTPDDPRRIRGALLTAVKFYAEKGNMFATPLQAIHTAAALSGTTEEAVERQLKKLIEEGRLVESKGGIYLPVYYEAEIMAAEKIASLIKNNKPQEIEFEIPTEDISGNLLNASQREAIITVMTNPVTVITGGPGTGKTTTVRGLVRLFEDMDKKVVLAAPTGRAAKRMAQLAGMESKTLHRLLGYRMGRGYRNKTLDADILVIDEASMLEQVMLKHLLDALSTETKVVLIGDTHQLPSIGAGDVLNRLMASGMIPVVTLRENFRQKSGSSIAEAAAAVKEEARIKVTGKEDFMVFYEANDGEILRRLLQTLKCDIPARLGIDAKDIQVVSPQQEGELGAKSLNPKIQETVNPEGPELKKGNRFFRLNDRVMQISNSSEHDVYNGETGWISCVDLENFRLEVTFYDGKKQWYGKERLKELTLAYAITVHKLQGSETDYLVMIISNAHRQLLYRNLLYTGISRARKLCVLIGEESAIRRALENDSPAVRNTNFDLLLREKLMPVSNGGLTLEKEDSV